MESKALNSLLVRKYNKPLPRYTSYPTVPFWKDDIGKESWISIFKARFSEENHINGISLYIHLPFCESLCTYCGCNKKITTNHTVEDEYLLALQKEWLLYKKLMNQVPVIREIHLGGGTPTFFSPTNLQKLLDIILKGSIIHPGHEFSIEGHPNNTTTGHLQMLFKMGFRRVSYGVQDDDARVQQIINRIQPFENVKKATEEARATGFTSVNFDLIYGLPLQTVESIERTIHKIIELRPDRVAFYSYAHVPWTSKAQRLFDESDLPAGDEKLRLYIKGKEILMENGYEDIGMDHFAIPSDDLYKARKSGRLHRNFMGYTTRDTGILLGLGVSAISDTGNAYAQNNKKLADYYMEINNGSLAVQKGYLLNDADKVFRKYILDISCRGKTRFSKEHADLLVEYTFPRLKELAKDGLIEWNIEGLTVLPQGHYFIRNICSAFDLYLLQANPNRQVFSMAI